MASTAADAERAKVLRQLLRYESNNKIKTVEDLAKRYKHFTTEELKEKRLRHLNKKIWERKDLPSKPFSWKSLLKSGAKGGLNLVGLYVNYLLDQQFDDWRKDELLKLYKAGKLDKGANKDSVLSPTLSEFNRRLLLDELEDSDQYRDYMDEYSKAANEQALAQAKANEQVDPFVNPNSFDLENYIANDPSIEWKVTKKPDLAPEYALAAEQEPEVAELIKQYEAQDAAAYRALRRKQLMEESERKWKESRKGGYKGPFDGYISYRDELKI